jgi:UPF0755 protein
MKRIILTAAILLLLAVAALTALYITLNRPYVSDRSYPITVEIPPGSSLPAIARILHREQVIRWPWSLRLWVRFMPGEVTLRYGRYRFDNALSLPRVIEKLQRGQVELQKITIREGLTRHEIADQLSRELTFGRDAFLDASASGKLVADLDPSAPDLEGYLFPETYLVDPSITAEEMVHLMVDRFLDSYTRNMQWRARDLLLSNRELLTLASLIEKETANRQERFLISSVFHNRLRLKMRLDCDPTVSYALKRDGKWDGSFSWADLVYNSPYNTRLYAGLPPGPICSPGLASLEAALYPEQTDYLYFVAKGGGNHHFSTTLKEHNSAVQRFIIRKNQN